MSEEPLYDDKLFEQLNSLPVPDEDGAWADMKQLLDDKRNRRVMPFWRRGFMLAAAALVTSILLTTLLLVHYSPGKKTIAKQQQPANQPAQKKLPGEQQGNLAANKTTQLQPKIDSSTGSLQNNASSQAAKTAGVKIEKEEREQKKLFKDRSIANRSVGNLHSTNIGKQQPSSTGKDEAGKNGTFVQNKDMATAMPAPANGRAIRPKDNDAGFEKEKTEPGKEITTINPAGNLPAANTNNNPAIPLNNNTNNADNNKTSPIAVSRKKFHVEVGISVQQPVRLDCNCIYPNDPDDNNNRPNMPELKDYIPSIYMRLYPAKKWFIQAEYKHDALEYTEELLYKSFLQNRPLNYITTSYILKKVYYNQVPVSFNYFITHNWSAGAGIIYNNFSEGVIQRDVTKKLYGTAEDSLINSKIITGNDSNFVNIAKSSFQGFVESEYKWKRFSFGARYAAGLQPFISYTDPLTHKPVEKRNSTLNFFIRLELWDSLKKKK